MSSVQKVKEFFGLVSYEEDDHDAYYADEAAYSAAPAPSYADRHTMPYDYQPEYQAPPRVYEAAVGSRLPSAHTPKRLVSGRTIP